MIQEKLTDDNFLVFAMHHYDNPQCHSLNEFDDDIKKFIYLKKLIYRYKNTDELKERLIINHIVVLHNIFGTVTTRMLFFKIEESLWPQLVTFLVFLNRMPEEIPEFGIKLSDISLDEKIIAVLRKI